MARLPLKFPFIVYHTHTKRKREREIKLKRKRNIYRYSIPREINQIPTHIFEWIVKCNTCHAFPHISGRILRQYIWAQQVHNRLSLVQAVCPQTNTLCNLFLKLFSIFLKSKIQVIIETVQCGFHFNTIILNSVLVLQVSVIIVFVIRCEFIVVLCVAG